MMKKEFLFFKESKGEQREQRRAKRAKESKESEAHCYSSLLQLIVTAHCYFHSQSSIVLHFICTDY